MSGKVAIVTGASSGIGAAISLHLARAGASVAMAARREEKLNEQKKLIEASGGVAIAIKCDVINRQEVCNCHNSVIKLEFYVSHDIQAHPSMSPPTKCNCFMQNIKSKYQYIPSVNQNYALFLHQEG